jgi:hypothetical protein
MLNGTSGLAGPCEDGHERSGSIKGGEFLDCLSDYWFLTKDSVCSIELISLVKGNFWHSFSVQVNTSDLNIALTVSSLCYSERELLQT